MENKNIVIQIDTREQLGKNTHLLAFFASKGVKTIRSKMVVGDYMNYMDPTISVDRKENMLELCMDIFHQHDRFKRECELAKSLGVQLVVLIECCNWQSVYQLKYWKPPVWRFGAKAGQPMVNAKGETIMKVLLTMHQRYGVIFMFCKKEDAGRIVYEILTRQKEPKQI